MPHERISIGFRASGRPIVITFTFGKFGMPDPYHWAKVQVELGGKPRGPTATIEQRQPFHAESLYREIIYTLIRYCGTVEKIDALTLLQDAGYATDVMTADEQLKWCGAMRKAVVKPAKMGRPRKRRFVEPLTILCK